MNIILRYIALVFVMLVFSCGPKKGIVTKKKHEKNKTVNVTIVKNILVVTK